MKKKRIIFDLDGTLLNSYGEVSEKNKKEVTMNRQEIIDMGYDPCKNCNP